MIHLLKTSLFLCLLGMSVTAMADGIHDVKVKDIDGKEVSLSQYKGKALLIVNVASECGLTPQYDGLEALHKKYSGNGLVVLGFPCNQFGAQEPGSESEIKQFCKKNYGVTFPLFSKIEVNGSGRHPLYKELAGEGAAFPGNIGWNFAKFLVGKDGKVIKRFQSSDEPESGEIVKAVEAALK